MRSLPWSSSAAKIFRTWDFRSSPVAKTTYFQLRGCGFYPWSGNWAPICQMACKKNLKRKKNSELTVHIEQFSWQHTKWQKDQKRKETVFIALQQASNRHNTIITHNTWYPQMVYKTRTCSSTQNLFVKTEIQNFSQELYYSQAESILKAKKTSIKLTAYVWSHNSEPFTLNAGSAITAHFRWPS